MIQLYKKIIIIGIIIIGIVLSIVITLKLCLKNKKTETDETETDVTETDEESTECETIEETFVTEIETEAETTQPIETEETTVIETIEYIEIKPYLNYSRTDVEILAQTVYGEAGGLSLTERAAVIWCVLNLYDLGEWKSIYEVIRVNFSGFNTWNNITDENINLAIDVLDRYNREKSGEDDVGRVLPKEYVQFRGGKKYQTTYFKNLANEYGLKKAKSHNWYFTRSEYFRTSDKYERKYYSWYLPSPYEN